MKKRKCIKVLTFGVFDYFHYGHLKLFEKAKKYGNYLIVAIQRDKDIKKRKPKSVLKYSFLERSEIITSLKQVDEVVPYSNVEDDIKTIDFDVFAIGEDQTHDGFQKAVEWCALNNKIVVRLNRWPGICSTDLKGYIK